jgi:adenosylhomocysteine nucleosidase
VVQRDMMALVPRGVTSLCDDDRTLTSGHGAAVCGTGGSFITSTDPWLPENKIDVVIIDLFATALACKRFGAPRRALKFMTATLTTSPTNTGRRTLPMARTLFWDVFSRDTLGRRTITQT